MKPKEQHARQALLRDTFVGIVARVAQVVSRFKGDRYIVIWVVVGDA